MYQNLLLNLKDVSPDEYVYLEQLMNGMNEKQASTFVMFYSGKRKTPQDILIFTLIGFLGFAGIQRFVIGQVGMGILYFFTGGLCLIGTIVDLINHRSLASEFNRKAAYECAQLISISSKSASPSAD